MCLHWMTFFMPLGGREGQKTCVEPYLPGAVSDSTAISLKCCFRDNVAGLGLLLGQCRGGHGVTTWMAPGARAAVDLEGCVCVSYISFFFLKVSI